MYKSFEKKEHTVNKNGNRHDVRKPNVDSSTLGGEIKKPIHLTSKKKSLLKEEKALLQKLSSENKKKKTM